MYLTAKEATLRDRVAAVSNRTGTVSNGEKLVVLDRARRFLKVRTPDGKVGWIEERLTADQALADQFDALKQQSINDTVVAQAAARDDVYLHIAPGRETDHFFRLSEGDTMSLLKRATVAKPLPPGVAPTPKPGEEGPPQPVMEDWWLVRTSKGQAGWIYSRMIDVTEPDALVRYSEGQRIVGAYVLTKVNDPESGVMNNGQVVSEIPEYVTVLAPYKAGLPYDFDQVRVFTWNVKKHRYETAFRDRNIAGYLPVKITTLTDPYGKSVLAVQKLPAFQYRVLSAASPMPTPDAKTGMVTPGQTIEKTYRLEETTVHRLLPPGTTAPEEMRPVPEVKKDKAKAGKEKKRR
ncbi:MAG: SH3 domain-containing protein [Acidobacteriaceae bacterium]|nr:SH3 domain-containing protein [Acidobacteriaceae bacterium]